MPLGAMPLYAPPVSPPGPVAATTAQGAQQVGVQGTIIPTAYPQGFLGPGAMGQPGMPATYAMSPQMGQGAYAVPGAAGAGASAANAGASAFPSGQDAHQTQLQAHLQQQQPQAQLASQFQTAHEATQMQFHATQQSMGASPLFSGIAGAAYSPQAATPQFMTGAPSAAQSMMQGTAASVHPPAAGIAPPGPGPGEGLPPGSQAPVTGLLVAGGGQGSSQYSHSQHQQDSSAGGQRQPP